MPSPPNVAFENHLQVLSGVTAGVDLSAMAFPFVRITSTGTIVAATAGKAAYGVCINKPANGRTGDVATSGVTRACASEAIAVGDPVAVVGVVGKVRVALATDVVVGIALSAAAADGNIIAVLLGDSSSLGDGEFIDATVGAEVANAIDVACAIVRANGLPVTAARQVFFRTLAVTADKGDLAAATAPLGTLKKVFNPATGCNEGWWETTAGGLASVKVSNDIAEETVLVIECEGCKTRVIKLTFA